MIAGDGGCPSETATWMRNAQIAVCAFMSVCAVSGLCFAFYSGFAGEVVRALAGALVAVGGVTTGFLALAAVRFGAMLVARTERIEDLVWRIEALEKSIETQGVPVDLARTGAGDPEKLVASNVQRDGFPRLVSPGPAPSPERPATAEPGDAGHRSREEHQWQTGFQSGDIAACRRSLDRLREVLDPERIVSMEEGLRAMGRARATQLREEFAGMVRSRNYAAALTTGEQIAELFPDSAMARDFASLRPRLTECARRRRSARPPSAV